MLLHHLYFQNLSVRNCVTSWDVVVATEQSLASDSGTLLEVLQKGEVCNKIALPTVTGLLRANVIAEVYQSFGFPGDSSILSTTFPLSFHCLVCL